MKPPTYQADSSPTSDVPGGLRTDIRRAIDARRAEILDWTMKLVRFPSENRPPTGALST